MAEWWASLTLIQKIFMYAAIPSSSMIILIGLSSVIGLGVEEIIDFDFDDPFELLNLKGLLAFFSIGGIIGYLLTTYNIPGILAIAGALASGTLAGKTVSKIISSMRSSEIDAKLNLNNAIGKKGKVYLTIPPNGEDFGKILIQFGGRLRELNAVSNCPSEIKTDDEVIVIDVDKNDMLIVEPATNYIKEKDFE